MESFIVEHAYLAHWVIFGLFMLAGLNIPISEDLLIISGGVLASTVVPENTYKLFIAIFLGAFISDIAVYMMGRYLGRGLFLKMFKQKRLEKMQQHYKKWGISTLFFGRFIPFGVRNCLFATAGLSRMSLKKFLLVDGIACLLSNSALFTFSYFCGKSCSIWLKIINVAVFSLFLIALFAFIWYKNTKTETSE